MQASLVITAEKCHCVGCMKGKKKLNRKNQIFEAFNKFNRLALFEHAGIIFPSELYEIYEIIQRGNGGSACAY